jgi:hypothetical protein
MVRRRFFSALMFAVLVSGCQASGREPSPLPANPAPGTVVLLTTGGGSIGCPLAVVEGDLVIDENAGSAVIANGVRERIRWPYGYAGRRSGNEVEILDRAGKVVGRTGTRVRLGGGDIGGVWLACTDAVVLR